MSKTILLRKKPELKFTFYSNKVEIIDLYETDNCDTFLFTQVKSVELNKEKTNWLFTIFSFILDVFSNINGVSSTLKNRANLKIVLESRTIKILISNKDLKKYQLVYNLIKENINK